MRLVEDRSVVVVVVEELLVPRQEEEEEETETMETVSKSRLVKEAVVRKNTTLVATVRHRHREDAMKLRVDSTRIPSVS